jgi:hypothetical protein
MFGFGKTKSTGADLIEEVVNSFATLVGDLDEAAKDCEGERESIESQIASLETRTGELKSSTLRARTLSTNLRRLME